MTDEDFFASRSSPGGGASATRSVAGTNHPFVELERELADFRGVGLPGEASAIRVVHDAR